VLHFQGGGGFSPQRLSWALNSLPNIWGVALPEFLLSVWAWPWYDYSSDTLRPPCGCFLFQVSCEMLTKIPVLRNLREREKQAGKDVTLRDEPGSQQPAPGPIRRPQDRPQTGSRGGSRSPLQGADTQLAATVCVGNLPFTTRVRELKRVLQELGVVPLRLTWQGPQHRAVLHYTDSAAAQQAASLLQGLRLGANALRVSLGQQRDM
jgi:hypothetical protein